MSTIRYNLLLFLFALLVLASACQEEEPLDDTPDAAEEPTFTLSEVFGGHIDTAHLYPYASQPVPAYVTRDNTADNPITDEGATLGRVLFYDKALSVDQSISCASCHKQSLAFGDDRPLSEGVNGLTHRHSMRLVNARFANEDHFFWDERAATLEEQSTMPIRDHLEMGFSGQEGSPGFEDLIERLENLPYYPTLFDMAFGDPAITEERMQLAISQFVRSIQSFDSKYDAGRAQVNLDMPPFPNFTPQENHGKQLFLTMPDLNAEGVRVGGGIGCAACHVPPTFDINPHTHNNGLTTVAGESRGTDLDNTRSPSLRDLFHPDGSLNGPMMHDGNFPTFQSVLDHYNNMTLKVNPNLDLRLTRNGTPQRLQITDEERAAVEAFMKTLSGIELYTAEQWSDPFLR
ncbi:MAG: cytochrome-c peroxidase [Bacteroidetes bacterium]|jgi:cytochrome c peroxidase|nr:cytochrome-c peroxidase [Bacteroidota bacterium]